MLNSSEENDETVSILLPECNEFSDCEERDDMLDSISNDGSIRMYVCMQRGDYNG